MPTNDFLPFATGEGANVLSQTDYAALTVRPTGFEAGRANSAQANKVLRQASIIASAVTSFIADKSGQDVLDDGTTATIEANLTAAIQSVILAYGFAPLASPSLTGTPTAPTPGTSDNSQRVATTAMVQNALVPYAPIASPAFTGAPSASTPSAGDNSGKLATTGFVASALGDGGTIYNPKFNSGTFRGIDAANGGQVRMEFGSIAVFLRNDGGNFNILLSTPGSPTGSFNSLRPLNVNLTTGAVTIDGTGAGTTFGATPTAPTMSASDSSTHLATTAFVKSQGYLTGISGPQVTTALGYTPVQQGGPGLGGNKVKMGWDGDHIRTQVDATDIGKLALFSDFASSLLGESGYQKLPNGLILQFGHAGVSGPGDTVTFPIPFPQRVIFVVTSDMGHGGAASGVHITSSSPVDNARVNIYAHLDNGTPAATDVGWLAFGY